MFIYFFVFLLFSCSASRINDTPKDYKNNITTNFESYDSDNDGKIDKKEFSQIKVENKESTQPITAMLLIIGSVAFMVMAPKVFSLIKDGLFNKD
tara:strand:+ start:535 stop:819 length:285 start_codon:yes stop_codon:yes gene_type:complete